MTEVETTVAVARLLPAPRERVWRAWTKPGELAGWWWPQRFETTYEVDLREGGRYRFRSADLPDIGVLSISGTFLEVRRPELLAYTWRWEHEEHETRVSVEFVELEDRSRVDVHHEGFTSCEERDNHVVGWNDCLDRLEARIAGG